MLQREQVPGGIREHQTPTAARNADRLGVLAEGSGRQGEEPPEPADARTTPTMLRASAYRRQRDRTDVSAKIGIVNAKVGGK